MISRCDRRGRGLSMRSRTETFVFIILVTILLFLPVGTQAAVYVAFRYDDFAGDAPGVRERDILRKQVWDAEQAIDRLFQKYDFNYTIAIIPNSNNIPLCADAEKTDFIKYAIAAGRVEVAQHGFTHTNFAGVNHRGGEFRDRDYQSQYQDIKKGRDILLSALRLKNVDVFVPPWNDWTYDTGRIVEELGFKILSADSYCYYNSIKKTLVIPFTSHLREIESLLVNKSLPDKSVIVVLYHPYDIVKFPNEKESWYFGTERFDKLLHALSTEPNVKVVTLGHLCEENADLIAKGYFLANKLKRLQSFWRRLLPPQLLPGAGRDLFYLNVQKYSEILRPWYYITSVFIAGIVAAGFLFRIFLGRRLSVKRRVRINIFAAVLLFISIFAEFRLLQRGYHITGIRAIPGLIAVGVLLGTLIIWIRRYYTKLLSL